MMDTIKHRGPDDAGEYIDNEAAIGFRRLSIVDLEGGSQPLYNEDDNLVLNFNGEIYNYQELRKTLIEKGHVFKTDADSEVILHGYEEYGSDICKKLRGMFSFVIWDKKKQTLFGARDHFGIKPFYYYFEDDLFIYGSEIKSFLKHPKFKKELNKKALKPYLIFQYSALPETFFKNVFKLKEGHYFTLVDNKLEVYEYWDSEYHEKDLSLEESIELIDKTVVESIELHKHADVEVASFLSSDVDSSYVTAVLKPDMSYSIGFGKNSDFNEQIEAKRLTEILGIPNTSETIDGALGMSHIPLIQYHMDEPDANPSCVPLYFLCQMASKNHKVVLSGEGADELFVGYQSYWFHTKSNLIKGVTEGLKLLPEYFSRPYRYSD